MGYTGVISKLLTFWINFLGPNYSDPYNALTANAQHWNWGGFGLTKKASRTVDHHEPTNQYTGWWLLVVSNGCFQKQGYPKMDGL